MATKKSTKEAADDVSLMLAGIIDSAIVSWGDCQWPFLAIRSISALQLISSFACL